MAISPALRGIPLILALLDEKIDFGEGSVKTSAFKWVQERSGLYLTGQVIAAYSRVRLTPPVVGSYRQDFGSPRRRDFAKLNLHLPACRSLGAGRTLFEQPGKDDFFSSLLRIEMAAPSPLASSGEEGVGLGKDLRLPSL
jgi:hypothetical protein